MDRLSSPTASRQHARGATLAASACLVACTFAASPAPAEAQMSHVPDTDWRQTDRHDQIIAAAKPALFYFEARFGPYWPAIDSAPEFAKTAATARPYEAIFGQSCTTGTGVCGAPSPLFYFGLELDAVPVRIPYLGALGLGFGWGYTHNSTLANFLINAENPSQPGGVSGETTSLTIMPMHLSIVLRGDELMRRTGVPIVPYGKIGAGILYWRATNDLGTEVYNPCEVIKTGEALPKGCTSSGVGLPTVDGSGVTPALHIAVGGMLSLNWLEPGASARLDETTGVHHAFLFGEYYNDQIVFASNSMRAGTSSFAVGLAADF